MRKKDELSKDYTCMSSAHPEEMTFVLLGRDAAAPNAIRWWVAERLRTRKNIETDQQIIEALACANTMEAEGRRWVGAATHYPPEAGQLLREAVKRIEHLEESLALTSAAVRCGEINARLAALHRATPDRRLQSRNGTRRRARSSRRQRVPWNSKTARQG